MPRWERRKELWRQRQRRLQIAALFVDDGADSGCESAGSDDELTDGGAEAATPPKRMHGFPPALSSSSESDNMEEDYEIMDDIATDTPPLPLTNEMTLHIPLHRLPRRFWRLTVHNDLFCATEKGELNTLPFLKVKDSSVPGAGSGLFAYKTFEKYTQLLRYGGVRRTRAEVKEIYDPDEKDKARKNKEGWKYMLELSGDRFIDASDSNRSNVARYINHSRRALVNCEFTQNGMVQTTRRIQAGEELFLSYSPHFSRQLRAMGFPPPSAAEYLPLKKKALQEFEQEFLRQSQPLVTAESALPAPYSHV